MRGANRFEEILTAKFSSFNFFQRVKEGSRHVLPNAATANTLLAPIEQPAAVVERAHGRGPLVVACEHASNVFPESVDRLGLPADACDGHFAWDPGALPLARRISAAFDAPLVAARFSRLVYDVNRPPEAPDAIRQRYDRGDVPGNQQLTAEQRAQRVDELYKPFRRLLKEVLDNAVGSGAAALVTVHSFTPVFEGRRRAVELGLLHDADARMVDAMLPQAAAVTGLNTARNEPYGPADGVTHTLVVDALPRNLPNVMLELRSDLLAEESVFERVSASIVALLKIGLAAIGSAASAPEKEA